MKLINKIFKKLGYEPIGSSALPPDGFKPIVVKHRMDDYIIITSTIAPTEHVKQKRPYIKRQLREMFLRELHDGLPLIEGVIQYETQELNPYESRVIATITALKPLNDDKK